jgi:protein SCO1/2
VRRAVLGLWLALVSACGLSQRESYSALGVVREIDAAEGQVTIAHEEIEGFMPAMTMNFDVAAAGLLEGIEPGMKVSFELLRDGTTLSITSLRPTGERVEGGHVGFDREGGALALEEAPDFTLIDHNGDHFSLSSLRGKAVLLDFIFTRCPGPCPILTAAHARLQRSLPAEQSERVHLVSVSLDPEYDTPARLQQYASTRGAELLHWSFVTGEPAKVQEVVDAYHVGTLRKPDGSLDHLIVSFLIDPEGRIVRRFVGLETPLAELQRAVEEALS